MEKQKLTQMSEFIIGGSKACNVRSFVIYSIA